MGNADPIRNALVDRLRAEAADGPALILHELAVGSGLASRRPVDARWYTTRGLRYYVSERNYCAEPWTARADVALLTPDALDLYEIKGSGDSLVRLRTQVRAYDDTGSRNTVVVHERHADRVYDAVPPAWGILVAHGDPVTLLQLRAAAPNPSKNVRGLTNPLYRRELLPLAHAYRARPGSRSDLVEFFARYAQCDVELHERWLRRQIASRNHVVARGQFGVIAGRKKRPAAAVGDVAAWDDRRLVALLDGVRKHHARSQLELIF
jgi:hypothetical protein